jgi:4-amino-4-deoxy-L-arabinose transferase-like glycosyltransferase
LDPRYAGSALEAYAGPASGPQGAIGQYLRSYQSGTLTAAQMRIVEYTTRHRDGARYLFATDSWHTASPYVLATGAPVLPMGGFSGEVASPTLEQFQHLVSTRQLRHVLLSNGGFSIFALLGGPPHATPTSAISDWVRHHCTPVPLDGATGAGAQPNGAPRPGTSFLYTCNPPAT